MYSLSSVDDFNLKFKKQSEKLKHYEGENIVKIANEAIIYVFILTCHFSGHERETIGALIKDFAPLAEINKGFETKRGVLFGVCV